ncbi:MAG: hypothetical protein JSW08_03055 [archaeon]|nr:MAG: hypothetical protein JSW08_03055 [archaeon]
MKQKNPWKTIGIIFIILFVAETAFFFYVNSVAEEVIEQQENCQVKCYDLETESYHFDTSTHTCYCFTNNYVVHTEIIE